MNSVSLYEVEKMVLQLPQKEQLWLAERIIHLMRSKSLYDKNNMEQQLAIMAEDSEIQKEIKNIKDEFMIAESDGLENL